MKWPFRSRFVNAIQSPLILHHQWKSCDNIYGYLVLKVKLGAKCTCISMYISQDVIFLDVDEEKRIT